eukprot:5087943-Prymnesium_polylepis.2
MTPKGQGANSNRPGTLLSLGRSRRPPQSQSPLGAPTTRIYHIDSSSRDRTAVRLQTKKVNKSDKRARTAFQLETKWFYSQPPWAALPVSGGRLDG